jgi:stage V sporulation protein D (sporulation-specific penicillin-binding protein)
VLTIEPAVQQFLERELAGIAEQWRAESVGGIVMNPSTGELYAAGSTPTFDPNRFHLQRDYSIFVNPITENVYEMGSTVKALTIAAGLDSGTISARSTFIDEGSMVLNGRRIANHDGRVRGEVTMQQVLGESLNTGVAHIALSMGRERFADYLRAFKLDEETGIDLPGETYGMLSNLNSNRDIEIATASFGQGIAVTPIAMTRALAALGNGGYLVTPHLAREVIRNGGERRLIAHDRGAQVISEAASEEVTRMLVEVVDTYLLNGSVKMPDYSIAAKTGTAQMAASGGGYYEDRFLHSFFGYFPAYDPQFIVFLFAVDPKGTPFASQTLTHPFMDITQFLLNYYEIPPDRRPF